MQKVAEGARFGPFQQGIGVGVDVDQGSQVTAIINEAGSREQLLELLVRCTKDRIGFMMSICETCLNDSLAKQDPGLVRSGRVLNVQSQSAARPEHAVNFPQGAVLFRDPVEHAVEVDRVELAVAKTGQILGVAGLERQRFRLPQPRHVDTAFQRIDPDDVALRADQAGDELGKPSCSYADVQDVLAGLDRERTDQELAVVKLNYPGLCIVSGQFGSIPFKADRSGSLRHCQYPSPLCLTVCMSNGTHRTLRLRLRCC